MLRIRLLIATVALLSLATAVPPALALNPAADVPRTGGGVWVAQIDRLGAVLTESHGLTLYVYKNDQPGQSNCTGACAQEFLPSWVGPTHPPLVGRGVPGKVGVIQRPDGTRQLTYNDMPLYYYVWDVKPGDTNGEGLHGLWSAVVITPLGRP